MELWGGVMGVQGGSMEGLLGGYWGVVEGLWRLCGGVIEGYYEGVASQAQLYKSSH